VHLDTLPRDAAAYGRHHTDLPGAEPLDLAAYPVPRPLGPTPRTIREHTGARTFGTDRAVALAADPTASGLQAAVGRWRARDAGLSQGCRPEPASRIVVHVHKPTGFRQCTPDNTSVTLGKVCALTSVLIGLWLTSGVIGAFVLGRL
jgi:hypothetical protein